VRALTKAQRLNELQRLLIKAYERGGISQEDLADEIGVDRTSIGRYIDELEKDGMPITTPEYGRYALAPQFLLNNVQFSQAESWVVYLAARRVARQSTHASPPMVSALEKLAETLRKSQLETLRKSADHTAELPKNAQKQAIFETLTQAYNQQLTLQLGYRGLHSTYTRPVLLCPYLFEPSPWGEGIYVIGHSETFQGLTTLKLERIERAELTQQKYTIPDQIDPDILLRHTWGVWMNDGDPVDVILHFSPYVVRRLQENRWHPTERLRDLPNGWVEWGAQVDEPQEMLPWIRGWGADVEVIAPESLRDELIRETERLMRRYGIRSEGDSEYDLEP
jgi:CRISPR-associated endonuclease/helicase Cas3